MQLLPFIVVLAGCATPSSRFDAYAFRHDLEKTIIHGNAFQHAIYRRASDSTDGRILHVYIGSDGTPWYGNRPSSDPTPLNPLALRLMLTDTTSSIYVGRPCYHGLGVNPECQEELWTDARYSGPIIDSMSRAIQNFARSSGYDSINLIGYSGGGVIATLAAVQVENVNALITIAANLDTDAWTEYHRYDRLTDSINPALRQPVRPNVQQLHLFGMNDLNVSPKTVDRYFERNPTASRRGYRDFDHRCCWESIWTELIDEISSKQPEPK